ncbi:DUF4190 domain-containing protein [Streptomyces sp. NPDC060184]|uniref:DUF4190 domain-containing protein n=1 Tax=Streptomyces sp. NPDC060184 TaxID=3347064 RepID=UPI0036482782
MTLSSLVTPVLHPGRRTDPDARSAKAGAADARPATTGKEATRKASAGERVRDADSLAVASFVLGLLGLLVFNLLLGPAAVVMALIALARSTERRARAFLGLALGVADLAVLAVLVTAHGTVAWGS